MQSNKWNLNQSDWERWSFNFVRFVVIPTAIAFLTTVQGGMDVNVAWGVAAGTLYTSCVDLFRKFLAGEQPVSPQI
jgi:hypothetical protein